MGHRKNPTIPGPDIEEAYPKRRASYEGDIERDRKPGSKRSKPWEKKEFEKGQEIPFPGNKPKHREDYEEKEEDQEDYVPHTPHRNRN